MKIAIAGSGMIAGRAVKALAQVPGAEVAAVFARPHSAEKAAALAAEAGGCPVYTDFGQMLAKAEADFVYIGLVNSAHYAYAKQALEAGFNVICEKPLCVTLAQAQEIAAIAREKGLMLLEAATTLHMPNFKALCEQLPRIGRIHLVQGCYCQYSSRYDRYLRGEIQPVFDPALAGGCLMDINCYLMNLLVGLFGAPKAVSYSANRGFNGIDTSGTVVLGYDGMTAVASAAKDSSGPSSIVIAGEKGWILIDDSPNFLRHFTVHTKDGDERFELNRYADKMVHEFIEFKEILESDDRDAMNKWLDVSLEVMEVLDKARADAGIEFS